jgi:tRNA A-37 threonylcarbamoyl transferase component Bud32
MGKGKYTKYDHNIWLVQRRLKGLLGIFYDAKILRKYATEKYIHANYGKVIDDEHVIQPPAVEKITFDILSDIIRIKHKEACARIKRLFSVDIEKYIRNYRIVKEFKEGNAYGTIFTVVPAKDLSSSTKHRFEHRHILKIQDNRKDNMGLALEYEAHVHRMFNKYKLAPRIFVEHHVALPKSRRRISIVVMDKYRDATTKSMLNGRDVSPNVLDHVYKNIVHILGVMCRHNLVHGDLHWDNIGVEFDEKLKSSFRYRFNLLDFGQSAYGTKCDRRLELLQLLRTLRKFDFTKSTVDYLEKKLYGLYKSISKHDRVDMTPKGPYGYEKVQYKLWNEYMDTIHEKQKLKYAKKLKLY